jgi:hypothetical protein
MSAPEALNSVKGIGPFGLKPPKFSGPGTIHRDMPGSWAIPRANEPMQEAVLMTLLNDDVIKTAQGKQLVGHTLGEY